MKKGFIIPIVFSMYNNHGLLERWNTQEYGIPCVEFLNKHWEFENSGGMEG